jgi:dipeptidyl aminopeptidase/acylaminoacyl peptidase
MTHPLRRLAPLAIALGALLALPAAAQVREQGALVFDGVPETPPALREAVAPYYNARSATFQDWLPDGSMLITTRFGDTYQVHRVTAPGADRTQLTFFSEPVTSAQALPDGRFLYPRDVGGAEYYQAFVRHLTGSEVQLTAPGTRNQSFAVSKDGKLIAWAQVTPGKPDYDIMLADPARPEGRRIVHKGTGAIAPADISRDGRRILLARYISPAETRLFVLDVASGAVTPAGETREKVGYSGPKFTPDGRILVLSDRGREVAVPVTFEPREGAPEKSLEHGDMKWGAEALRLSPNGLFIAYLINEDGYSRVRLRGAVDGELVSAPDLPKGVVTGFDFSPDGKSLAISLSTSIDAGDVWVWTPPWNTADQKPKLVRWTHSELGGIPSLVEPELIRYPTFDKREIPAFIYRPLDHSPGGKTGKLPVIIQIHGGPEAQELPSFNARRQSWVNEIGAVVIVPNVRGSSGYGKSYLALDNGAKREDSVKDIGALLDWVAAQPDLDADRVAVVGQSYGGYMALAVAGRYNDRIAGAIDLYGISNWVTFLENTEGYRRDLRRAEYGDERDPAMRKVFDEISPTAYVSAMKKPMMIYQGANDPRVPRSESEAIVARLRAQGTPVWYVLAKDEGHGIARKSNQEAVRATEILFLKQVLGVE